MKLLIVLLPCMGGNIMTYRYPVKNWNRSGYGVLYFNPPGHGKSDGVFHFEKTCELLKIELDKILNTYGKDIPITGIGHSGGGSTLMKFFYENSDYNLKKLILLSPILDTVRSLRELYIRNNIQEFTNSLRLTDSRILSILSNDKWLNPDYWEENDLKNLINDYSNEIINGAELGTFLENIFIPTKEVHSCIGRLKGQIVFIYPTKDIWYPIEEGVNYSNNFQFPYYTISSAKDHFFKNAWKFVSEKIDEIFLEIDKNKLTK
ncbi:MAG: alpha/beta hydrolase [Leptospiraceae bacterium]|nr:alpha/beta hydrolase [Leptospiraceae bacterium]MCK6380353.1 alpha/beta hydrolase [Leptospiraceae bacterium]NUM40876.1 alpha/beta hydrolase [Leptospiraceae bacterium]